MKTKILAALKTKYSNLGLSDKAFDGVAALLAKTVEKEEEIDAIVAGAEVESLLKSIQGSVDAERTRAAKAAKDLDDYKKEHPEAQPGADDPELRQLRDDLAAQKKAFEELQADYRAQVKQGRHNALRDEVRGKADELKVSNVPIWDDVVAAVEVNDETTADALLSSVRNAYEAKLKAYIGDGAAPYRGEGSGKPAEVTPEGRAKKAKEDADRVRRS